MIHQVHALSDPLVAPYLDVTSKEKRDSSDIFIAEGENVVYRLLASSYQCASVLCVDRKVGRFKSKLQLGTTLLVAEEKLLQQIVGFKFHSGVMGVGVRREYAAVNEIKNEKTILVLPEITDSANLGAILRIAAAFGVRCVVLGEKCRDPFIRQTIRTSMGTIFSLSLIKSENIIESIKQMQSEFHFNCVATVLDSDASPLASVIAPPKTALILGNEGPGLERTISEICDQRVTIPMKLGTDSLNVAVAAGVFLFHFTK